MVKIKGGRLDSVEIGIPFFTNHFKHGLHYNIYSKSSVCHEDMPMFGVGECNMVTLNTKA